jgi:hypothetical protein
MSTSPKYEYRSAAGLATCAAILLVTRAIISAVAAFSTAAQFPVLDEARAGHVISLAVAESHDSRQRMFAAIYMSVALAEVIVYLVWVYCANRNAHALGADKMQYSPAWSVGCFFIPLANLVMPFLMLRELWKASSPISRGRWQEAAVSPVLGAWWALSVFYGMFHYGPFPVLLGKQSLTTMVTYRFGSTFADWLWEYAWGLLAWYVMGVAMSVLTLVVLVSIQKLQEQKRLIMEEQETPELEFSA